MSRQVVQVCDICGKTALAVEIDLPEGWSGIDFQIEVTTNDDSVDLSHSLDACSDSCVRTALRDSKNLMHDTYAASRKVPRAALALREAIASTPATPTPHYVPPSSDE